MLLPITTASCSFFSDHESSESAAAEVKPSCPVCPATPSCTPAPPAAQTTVAAAKNHQKTAGESAPDRAQWSQPKKVKPKPSTQQDLPDALPAELRVKRLVIAHGVEDREPVDPTESFSLQHTKRIYAFVEVRNVDQVESAIYVTFEPEKGPSRGHVRLRVGQSPRWRTWAYTRAVQKEGSWWAVVRDGQGKELARKPFEIKS